MMGRFSLGLQNHGAPYNLFDMADDAALLLERLGIEKTEVIGASMGGMIAQILAAKYADRVNNLGLLFTSNNQPFLPPPFPKQLFSLLERPKSQDENGIVDYSLNSFKVIGSPGYVNQTRSDANCTQIISAKLLPCGCTSTVFSNIMYRLVATTGQTNSATYPCGTWFARSFAPTRAW